MIDKDYHEYRSLFIKIDEDCDGVISKNELIKYFN